jgi:hypothetical protein
MKMDYQEIRVIFTDKTCGRICLSKLYKMIGTGNIAAFCMGGGWVPVGQDPIRSSRMTSTTGVLQQAEPKEKHGGCTNGPDH